MMFHSALLFTLLIFVLSCSTGPPFTPHTETVATVVQSTGIPALTRKSRPYVLGTESRLYQGDIVRTDAASMLEFELVSGSKVVLSPRSELHLEKVSTNGSEWLLRLTLTSGAMEVSSTDAVTRMTIRTSIALLTTLGPNFWVGYSAGFRRLDVVSLGPSAININNPDGHVMLTSPMEASSIIPGAAPRSKTTWSATKLQSTRQTFNRMN